MANNTKWNEEDLVKKGFVKDDKGNWGMNPLIIKNELKTKFNQFIDSSEGEFIAAPKPSLSWFIKYNVPSKKNSRINLKSGISIPSKKHSEYVKLTEMQYAVFGNEFRKAVDYYMIKPPYKIEFTFIRGSQHSFDYCNAAQTCEDMMKDQYKKKVLVRKGWFPDDSADYIIPYFKPYQYDKANPGVIIKLLLNV